MMYTMMNRRVMPDMMMMDRVLRGVNGMRRPSFPMMRVDVREDEQAYILMAELPGVQMQDIDLTLENDVLTIAADLNPGERTDKQGYRIAERRSGHVERSFTLEGIDQAAITANAADGILTIVLPKEKPVEGSGKRRIAIGSAKPAVPAIEAPEA